MVLRPPARAIALTGFMGTGKTTVGRLLAEQYDLEFVDTDSAIEQSTGCSIPAIFENRGEDHFRDLETAALMDALSVPGRVISTGGGILTRQRNCEALQAAGPVVCLAADPATILERTAGDEYRPLLQVDDPQARIEELLNDRAQCYALADHHVDTNGLTPEETLHEVVAALRGDPRGRWHLRPVTRLTVDLPGSEYSITVGRDLLADLGTIVPPAESGVTCALVTTDQIEPLYAERTIEALAAAGWDPHLLTIRDGETSKSLAVAGELWERLAKAGLDRGSTLFALGGGVVGDVAGFVAATYMRGIALVHLPTSLLAQVDSSIGGKTAIDLSAGKNLVGAFHQPVAVVTDVGTLATLPDAEMRSGLGEIIKHACCFDAEMFEFMEERRDDVLRGDGAAIEYLVARNCQIKASIVTEDPQEKGLRAVLNYGHTVGHAIERAVGEWGLRHGEVVGAGIVAESRLAVWLGRASEETAARQERLVAEYGLPTSVEGADEDRALSALERDKKIIAGKLRMPLVPEVGSFEIVEDVDLQLVRRALRSVLHQV
jgi:shikimate kinase / 3-dehydroquinate synthase